MIRRHLFALLAGTLVATTSGAQQPKARSSDAEKLEAAADNLARMSAAVKQVLERAEQARNDKDVVRLNCVNEKLTQMKALIKGAEQADLALRDSLATRETGEAEFSKIAIARAKVDRLRGDSEQCLRQVAYVIDDKTTVELQPPPGLPGVPDGLGVANRGENPADAVPEIGSGDRAPPFVAPSIVRPPAASPFR